MVLFTTEFPAQGLLLFTEERDEGSQKDHWSGTDRQSQQRVIRPPRTSLVFICRVSVMSEECLQGYRRTTASQPQPVHPAAVFSHAETPNFPLHTFPQIVFVVWDVCIHSAFCSCVCNSNLPRTFGLRLIQSYRCELKQMMLGLVKSCGFSP